MRWTLVAMWSLEVDVSSGRGTVLLTGVGRRRSIGAGLALGLADDGWDLALSFWAPYDERVGLEHGAHDPEDIADECRAMGRRVELLPGDLASPDEPARLVAAASSRGDLKGLVMAHCESVNSSILDTTIESWERHFAVNARASWLLITAFAGRIPDQQTAEVTGRSWPSPATTRRTTSGTEPARARSTALWSRRQSSSVPVASAPT